MKRQKLSSKKSKRDFSRHAATTHRKNVGTTTSAMRGGIRL